MFDPSVESQQQPSPRVTNESLKATATPVIDVLRVFLCVLEGAAARGWRRAGEGLMLHERAVGQVKEEKEEWVVARDLSCSKLNLSSSLLLQPQPFCPWALSAE